MLIIIMVNKNIYKTHSVKINSTTHHCHKGNPDTQTFSQFKCFTTSGFIGFPQLNTQYSTRTSLYTTCKENYHYCEQASMTKKFKSDDKIIWQIFYSGFGSTTKKSLGTYFSDFPLTQLPNHPQLSIFYRNTIFSFLVYGFQHVFYADQEESKWLK